MLCQNKMCTQELLSIAIHPQVKGGEYSPICSYGSCNGVPLAGPNQAIRSQTQTPLVMGDPLAWRLKLVCTIGVLICHCSSAYLQEKLFLVPGFTFGFYLTFMEFVVNSVLAFIIHFINACWSRSPFNFAEASAKEECSNSADRNGIGIMNGDWEFCNRTSGGESSYCYFLLAISAVVSVGCSNTSLRYVSYPTKIVVKASKVVLTMVSNSF